jgi:hypothetical protein
MLGSMQNPPARLLEHQKIADGLQDAADDPGHDGWGDGVPGELDLILLRQGARDVPGRECHRGGDLERFQHAEPALVDELLQIHHRRARG